MRCVTIKVLEHSNRTEKRAFSAQCLTLQWAGRGAPDTEFSVTAAGVRKLAVAPCPLDPSIVSSERRVRSGENLLRLCSLNMAGSFTSHRLPRGAGASGRHQMASCYFWPWPKTSHVSPRLILQKVFDLGARDERDGYWPGRDRVRAGVVYGGWRAVATFFGVRAQSIPGGK
jgi:hypothetical protein